MNHHSVNSSSSSAPVAVAATGKVQRANWLMRDVGKSVFKFRDDLIVMDLLPSAATSEERRAEGLRAWREYCPGEEILLDVRTVKEEEEGEDHVNHGREYCDGNEDKYGQSEFEGGSKRRDRKDDEDEDNMEDADNAESISKERVDNYAGGSEEIGANDQEFSRSKKRRRVVQSSISGRKSSKLKKQFDVSRDLLPSATTAAPLSTALTVLEPDPDIMARPLVDVRHTILEWSMFQHLQFDSLRRAKHATSILLYHLHFPGHSLDAYCCACNKVLEGLRWHCSICTDYDVCHDCRYHRNNGQLACPHAHPLTPYHVTSFSD